LYCIGLHCIVSSISLTLVYRSTVSYRLHSTRIVLSTLMRCNPAYYITYTSCPVLSCPVLSRLDLCLLVYCTPFCLSQARINSSELNLSILVLCCLLFYWCCVVPCCFDFHFIHVVLCCVVLCCALHLTWYMLYYTRPLGRSGCVEYCTWLLVSPKET
jgi:hypothetical protein